ncbi:MAG: methionine gamma-lyase family protein, partial [Clostridia bacterium]|nr:methionine gamma-lyase family protein [Clostridia bacterium]
MDFYGSTRNSIEEANFNKVLEAMMSAKIGDRHLHSSTGYGYDDIGRDALEEIYAKVFGTEAALMRQQIVSGTHAISLALMGNLLPGD